MLVPAVPRVLIVDDDASIRLMLHDLLDDCGLDVVGLASDGLEALDLIDRLLPDIVVLDVRMPGMGGIDLARRLRGTAPSIRVVLFTAFDDPAVRLRAAEAGVFATVIKGQHPGRLMQAIREAWISGGLLDHQPGAAGGSS